MSVAKLLDLPKYGSGIGLHRVAGLCRKILESPWWAGLDALKVTGSNGKGSTCAMIASILRELGISHGLYTSPHLMSFHERIVLDGERIEDGELADEIRWVLARCEGYAAAHPGDTVGSFEAITALALHFFAGKRPETLVVEAGIGGRYDPARIVPGRVAGLTSLDLEHTEILGATLELIAYDKADLCPDGGVLVLGGADPETRRRLAAYCRLRDIQLVEAAERVKVLGTRFDGERMTVDFEIAGERLGDLAIGLPGLHQVSNAAVALLMVREWLARHRLGLERTAFFEAVRRGLAAVEWPGRFEKIGQDPDVFIDVGHTPGAVAALVEAVRTVLRERRIVLVTGVSYDKQVESIVSRLLPLASRVVCTRAYHKGSPVARIADVVRRERPEVPMEVEERIEDAMARAVARAREEGMTVLVAGGLFLSIEAARALRGEDPRALRFF